MQPTPAYVIKLLQERGVTVKDIAQLVMFIEYNYLPHLTPQKCVTTVQEVLTKRDVQNTIITAIFLDKQAEKHPDNPTVFQDMMNRDDRLYGVDENMALAIVQTYNSIALTNFGYLDKMKPGILKKLNRHQPGEIHVFLDDIVAAIAAAAAAKLAHQDQTTSALPAVDPQEAALSKTAQQALTDLFDYVNRDFNS